MQMAMVDTERIEVQIYTTRERRVEQNKKKTGANGLQETVETCSSDGIRSRDRNGNVVVLVAAWFGWLELPASLPGNGKWRVSGLRRVAFPL